MRRISRATTRPCTRITRVFPGPFLWNARSENAQRVFEAFVVFWIRDDSQRYKLDQTTFGKSSGDPCYDRHRFVTTCETFLLLRCGCLSMSRVACSGMPRQMSSL